MNEWQPIETAPKDSIVDIWAVPPGCELQHGSRFAECQWDGEWFDEVLNPILPHCIPTHWMPLPAPPK